MHRSHTQLNHFLTFLQERKIYLPTMARKFRSHYITILLLNSDTSKKVSLNLNNLIFPIFYLIFYLEILGRRFQLHIFTVGFISPQEIIILHE